MALDFVSPENVGECIRLAGEFRILPQNHKAKEDKLEVCFSQFFWWIFCAFVTLGCAVALLYKIVGRSNALLDAGEENDSSWCEPGYHKFEVSHIE